MQEKRFKRALVTGATSGIGEALARLLAQNGMALILTGRNRERLERLAAELETQVEVEIIVADLSQPIERAIVAAKIRDSVPDLVVNNAGLGLYGEVIKQSKEKELQMVRVDVEALVDLTLEAARALADSKQSGVILNVSSAVAWVLCPKLAVYSASKAFVNQFSESLDWELKSQGIRVLAACPGVVATRFRERAGGKADGEPPAMTPEYAAQQIWWQIRKGRPIHVFSWRYRFLTFLTAYIIPKSWVARITSKRMDKITV